MFPFRNKILPNYVVLCDIIKRNKRMNMLLLILIYTLLPSTLLPSPEHLLEQSLSQYSKNISFNYRIIENKLGHYSKAWQTKEFIHSTKVNFSENKVLVFDEVKDGKVYKSQEYFDDDLYYKIPHGKEKHVSVSEKDRIEFIKHSSIYSPVLVLKYLLKNKKQIKKRADDSYHVFYLNHNNGRISVKIDKRTNLVKYIYCTSYDSFYGNVRAKTIYHDYNIASDFCFPRKITQEKLGIKTFESLVSLGEGSAKIKLPFNYKMGGETEKIKEEIKYKKYSKNIHFLILVNSDSRVLIAEFDKHLLLIGAPHNSEIGEQIIQKCNDLFPKKPIKYFSFGHHHPHYLGGVRSLIYNGTEIITLGQNKKYIEQIASFSHSLNPDRLHKSPKEIKFIVFKDSLRISDDEFTCGIYKIGDLSNHTSDYLIYYFPNEKMLFQEDGLWIRKGIGDLGINPRTRGIYDGIKKWYLDVGEITQAWPLSSHFKTELKMDELEALNKK